MALYLVTGGCGFIGSHLASALVSAGHRVRILDDLSTGKRENAPAAAELIVGDVADPSDVAAAMQGVDGCFHLAAIASVQRCVADWAGSHRINLGGAIHVFDAARRARPARLPPCGPKPQGGGPKSYGGQGKTIPVVYASSAAVYGDNPNTPLDERAELKPLSAYGADKVGCELHARVAAHVHGVPAIGLRFFNVYGSRQDPSSSYSGVISIFAQRIVAGEELTIFGDGEQVRDFVYVADAVRALVAAMRVLVAAPVPDAVVYNVCTGRPTSIKALAATLGAIRGQAPRLRFAAARVGDIRISIGNGACAAEALGVRAETRLEDGLGATLASIESAP